MNHVFEWPRGRRPFLQKTVGRFPSFHFVPNVPAVPDKDVVSGIAYRQDRGLIIDQETVID
jgi:hypothetical protein